jgi:hypothetical protein
MARTKMKFEKQQRAITQKLRNAEQQFLCTALLSNKIMSFKSKAFIIYEKWPGQK